MTSQQCKRRRQMLLSVAALACALSVGCSDKDEESDVLRQRAVWASHGITNYRFQFQQGCFCDPITSSRVSITVADGAISSVRDVHADTLVSASFWTRFKTIDQLFDIVLRAENEADRLDVEYDSQYGYPSFIDVYWDAGATDNGWVAEASELEAR